MNSLRFTIKQNSLQHFLNNIYCADLRGNLNYHVGNLKQHNTLHISRNYIELVVFLILVESENNDCTFPSVFRTLRDKQWHNIRT